MPRYLLRRGLESIPTLLAISFVLFALLHIAPGGPTAIYASSPYVDRAELEAIEARLGLREPLPIQYGKWLTGMLTGDWGLSYKYAREARASRLEQSVLRAGCGLRRGICRAGSRRRSAPGMTAQRYRGRR